MKYSVIQEQTLNNTDIEITRNGNYTPGHYTGFNVVRVKVPEPKYTSLTINPSIENQTFTVEDIYAGYSPINVKPVTKSIDSNIKASNIKKGVSILGVEGNLEFTTEELTVDPSTKSQVKKPSKNGYSKVTINPVTNDIDGNILPENILQGIQILGITGTAIESKETTRNIVQNGLYEPPAGYTGFSSVEVAVIVEHEKLTINPSITTQTFTAKDDYHGYSPVIVNPVTNTIDKNIKAENIKEGIKILGITGTHPDIKNQDLTITTNGDYTFDKGYTGLGNVKVNINTVNNTSLTVTPSTSQQTFEIESPYTGYEPVIVNAAPLQTKTIKVDKNTQTIFTVNPDKNYIGLSSVKVDMSWIEEQLEALNAGDTDTSNTFEQKTVEVDGTQTTITVTPSSGYDGISKVTIDCSGLTQYIDELKGQAIDTDLESILNGSGTQFASDVSKIRNYACYNYTDLKTVKLNNATSIGDYAFANSGLTNLTIRTNVICILGNHALDNTPIASGEGNIYVPSSLVNNYKTSWSNYSDYIKAIS